MSHCVVVLNRFVRIQFALDFALNRFVPTQSAVDLAQNRPYRLAVYTRISVAARTKAACWQVAGYQVERQPRWPRWMRTTKTDGRSLQSYSQWK